MANKITPLGGGVQKVELDTTAVVPIGNADTSRVSKWIIHAKMGGGSPGSAQPKKAARYSGLTGSDLIAPVYYKDTDSTEITNTTPITTNDVYEVVVDGCDLYFDYTSGASGMTLYCVPVTG